MHTKPVQAQATPWHMPGTSPTVCAVAYCGWLVGLQQLQHPQHLAALLLPVQLQLLLLLLLPLLMQRPQLFALVLSPFCC